MTLKNPFFPFFFLALVILTLNGCEEPLLHDRAIFPGAGIRTIPSLSEISVSSYSGRNSSAVARVLSKPITYPYSFVLIGDTRPDNGGLMINPYFVQLMSQIAQLEPAPSFIINLGDLVLSGERSEYVSGGACLDIIDAEQLPFISVVGNHELDVRAGRNNYHEFFGEENFYFDFLQSRFIILNNAEPGGYGLSDLQLNGLELLLNDDQPKNTFIFMHVPMTASMGNCHRFRSLAEAHGVELVAYGHRHFFQREVSNDVTYLVSGGGGQQLDQINDQPPEAGRFHHFVLFTIDADGSVSGKVVKMGDGTVPDHQYDFVL